MKANQLTNIEFVNHIRAKAAWDAGLPIQVRHVRDVAWRDYNPCNPKPAFNNPSLRWRPASGYVSDDKSAQREFIFVGTHAGRGSVGIDLHLPSDYLTIDSFTPVARKPKAAMPRSKLARINYTTAQALCNKGAPIYSANCWWRSAYLVRNTLDKDIYEEYYIETETYNKLMSTLNKPEQEPFAPPTYRTSKQAFEESRPAQEAWLRGEPVEFNYAKQGWREYIHSDNKQPSFGCTHTEWRPKPRPRRVPFTLATLPQNAWWRQLSGGGIAHQLQAVNITSAGDLEFKINGNWYSAATIAENWEFSIDLKTWFPAYTEVNE